MSLQKVPASWPRVCGKLNNKFQIQLNSPEETAPKRLKILVHEFVLLNEQYVRSYKPVSFV